MSEHVKIFHSAGRKKMLNIKKFYLGYEQVDTIISRIRTKSSNKLPFTFMITLKYLIKISLFKQTLLITIEVNTY